MPYEPCDARGRATREERDGAGLGKPCPTQAVLEGRKAQIGDELRCLACDKPTLRA